MRHSRGAGLAVASTALDQHLGPGGAGLGNGRVRAAAIDDDHGIDHLARQRPYRWADRARFVEDGNNGGHPHRAYKLQRRPQFWHGLGGVSVSRAARKC